MALTQKGNRTYSGLSADKPESLPEGSVFIDTENPSIFISDNNGTLSNVTSGDTPTKTSELINDGDDGTTPYTTVVEVFGGNVIFDANYFRVQNFEYFVYASDYIINGIRYQNYISDTVTLSGASNQDRIDVIAINNDETFSVIQGIPDENPIKPEISGETQIELTFVLVQAGAIDPVGVFDELIYNENLGTGGGEWNTSVSTAQVNPNYTGDSQIGSTSISFSAVTNGDYINFDNDTFISGNDLSNIVFRVKILNEAPQRLGIRLYNTTTGQSGLNLNIDSGQFGFNGNILNVWQTLIIPKTLLGISGINFNRIRIFTRRAGVIFLIDNVIAQNGTLVISTGPTTTNTSELINDGEDGINPFITINDVPTVDVFTTIQDVLTSDLSVSGISASDATIIAALDTYAQGYEKQGNETLKWNVSSIDNVFDVIGSTTNPYSNSITYNNKIYAVGNGNTILEFNPSGSSINEITITGTGYNRLVVFNDKLYLTGSLLLEFNPSDSSFNVLTTLEEDEFYGSDNIINNKLYLVGGVFVIDFENFTFTDVPRILEFDPSDSSINKIDFSGNTFSTSQTFNDKIYIFTYDSNAINLSNISEFNPSGSSFSVITNLNGTYYTSQIFNNKIYAFGPNSALEFNPNDLSFSEVVLTGSSYANSYIIGDKIYATGGSSLLEFNPNDLSFNEVLLNGNYNRFTVNDNKLYGFRDLDVVEIIDSNNINIYQNNSGTGFYQFVNSLNNVIYIHGYETTTFTLAILEFGFVKGDINKIFELKDTASGIINTSISDKIVKIYDNEVIIPEPPQLTTDAVVEGNINKYAKTFTTVIDLSYEMLGITVNQFNPIVTDREISDALVSYFSNYNKQPNETLNIRVFESFPEINFDVTANWAGVSNIGAPGNIGVTDELSFINYLERYSSLQEVNVTSFELQNGNLRCAISATDGNQIDLRNLSATTINMIDVYIPDSRWQPGFVFRNGITTIDLLNNNISNFNPTLLPSTLETLTLVSNQIVTFNPSNALPSTLEQLQLSGNQIVTFDPTTHPLPSNLEILHLSSNQIVTFDPTTHPLPSTLLELHLGGNPMSIFDPSIPLPSTLRELYLNSNQIVTFDPSIPLPSNLQELRLDDNLIVTFDPSIPLPNPSEFIPGETIPSILGLRTLRLNNNQIITFDPTIPLPDYLQYLYLNDNQIVTFNPTLRLPYALQYLYLNDNQLTTFDSVIPLPEFLSYLHLENNQLTTIDPTGGLPEFLRELHLDNNLLTEFNPSLPYGQLTLQELYLNNNQLTDFNPTQPISSALRRLEIQFNQLSGFTTTWVFPVTTVNILIGGNLFTTSSYTNMENWANLQNTNPNANITVNGIDSASGTNFESILLGKSWDVFAA